MGLQTAVLDYEADNLAMSGHFAWDDAAGGPRPAVLVFPELFGLGEHAMAKAERLVTDFGYAALACDLHGGRQVIDDLDTVRGLMDPVRSSAKRVRARTMKAMEALAVRPEVDADRIAAIGFCYGGTMAFELALAGADIKAAIGFHSGLAVTSPQDAGNIKGKVMALLGAEDPGIPPEQRLEFEEMLRKGGVDWQMHLYGGVVHSFTDPGADARGKPDFLRYDAVADARSWKEMALLLEEVFA